MLDISKQFELAMLAIGRGDIDSLEKILTNPAAVTPDELRTTAQRLGFKDRFLSTITDVVTDPVVWASFLMSKRFPTLAWLKGVVPDRYIGAANEFTGISQFTRPIQEYFRGTPIPRLVALKEYRESQIREIGAKILGAMERPNWREEMPKVSLMLEGVTVPGVSSDLVRVADEIRGGMNEIWHKLADTKKILGGFAGEQIGAARAENWKPNEAPKYLRNYLPHIPLLGDASVLELDPKEAVKKLGMGKVAQVMEAVQENAGQVWSPDTANRLSSSFARYQLFLNKTQGQVYNPNLFRRQRMDIPIQSLQGQDLFVTDLNVVLQKYIQSAARTYALNAPLSNHERALAAVRREDGSIDMPTADPIIVQTINRGLEASLRPGAALIERPVAGTNAIDRVFVPGTENPHALTALQTMVRAMKGDSDEGEILMSNLFNAVGHRIDSAIDAAGLGHKAKAQTNYALQVMRRNRQQRAVMNGLTSYFYATTLGLNPWSAFQNLLQPIVTTAPAIGIGATLRGAREVASRAGSYSREFQSQLRMLEHSRPGVQFMANRVNEAAQRAFNIAFPELAEAGLKLDPRLFDMNPNSTSAFGPNARKYFKTYDDYAKFILQPFTHAELLNQATTFYGTKHKLRDAMRTGEYELPMDVTGAPMQGAALDDWLNFEASNVVNSTQFRPGPGSRTVFQSRLPAPLRMFTSFPTRALSFMVESTVRGAMTKAQLDQAGLLTRVFGGRNWGTLARIMLYGRIAQHGAADLLDVDLSGATGITSPFTFTPQGEFLAPLPISPVAGTVVGVVSAAANRDISKLKPMYLPGVGEIPIPKTLIPGGTAIARAVKAYQQFRPDLGGFVDEDERLMWRGNTSDMVLAMLGVPTMHNRRSREALDMIGDVRQKVTQFRRQYAVAKANYDVDSMRVIEQKYAEAFPDWPALSVTDRDVSRYQQMARMPMIERMLKTMGQTGKYLERNIYEADPDLVEQGDGTPTNAFGPLPMPTNY